VCPCVLTFVHALLFMCNVNAAPPEHRQLAMAYLSARCVCVLGVMKLLVFGFCDNSACAHSVESVWSVIFIFVAVFLWPGQCPARSLASCSPGLLLMEAG
jgi:hypothetical protein